MLKLLASQAAISLENTRLYGDLAGTRSEDPALGRRQYHRDLHLECSKVEIIEANEAFLRMVGYGREDLVSGRVSWTELTPAEWRDRDERRWQS